MFCDFYKCRCSLFHAQDCDIELQRYIAIAAQTSLIQVFLQNMTKETRNYTGHILDSRNGVHKLGG